MHGGCMRERRSRPGLKNVYIFTVKAIERTHSRRLHILFLMIFCVTLPATEQGVAILRSQQLVSMIQRTSTTSMLCVNRANVPVGCQLGFRSMNVSTTALGCPQKPRPRDSKTHRTLLACTRAEVFSFSPTCGFMVEITYTPKDFDRVYAELVACCFYKHETGSK